MAAESVLAEVLSDLMTEFNRRAVEYALAGGWAYSALVEPRATTDIDLLILVKQPTHDTVRELLSPPVELDRRPPRSDEVSRYRHPAGSGNTP